MLLKCKSPFNGKTNKIIITILSILLGLTLIRIWIYNVQISNFNTRLSESFHAQAKSSLQYIYTCFLNTSQPFSSFVPSDLKNDIKYAVMVDAGSSGSRVYIYYWSAHSEESETGIVQLSQLVDLHDQPIVNKVSPGLTNFRNPRLAYKNGIKPLLTFVLQHIPDERIPFTPVYVLATAGMRLIPTLKQNRIISEVEYGIKRDFKFKFPSDSVRVISGIDEGVYSWVAINYILNRLDASNLNSSSQTRTVGSLDMGGGSLQITYELPWKSSDEDSTNIEIINFGLGHRYKLYVTTYLNFGANQVREAHFSNLAETTLFSLNNFSIHNQSALHIIDPCLHRSQSEFRTFHGRPVNFTGSGNYNLCRQLLTPHLNHEDPCPPTPIHCKMNGVYQAPIDFAKMTFYGFSEFWYTMEDVLNTGGVYFRDKFDLSAREYCSLDWNTVLDWRSKDLYPRADFERSATQCFKSAWLSVAIHRGFGFPDNYKNLQSTDRIEGREIQWTMGALLYKLMHSSDNGLNSFSHIYSINKRFSYDYILPIISVLIALMLLFLVWYFFISKRYKKSGGKSFLPLLDTIKKHGHSRASSFPFPPTPSHKVCELPRVTSNNSLRSILSLNGDRESSLFIDVEKVK